jgi:uncharacterized repeat protein (TIGR02543 family)
MKGLRKKLAEIMAILLVIGMMPVTPGMTAYADTETETATESDALEDGTVSNAGKVLLTQLGAPSGNWNLEDYERSTDSNAKVITLKKYNGSDTKLYVPGSVTVDGTVYTIALNSAYGNWENGIWYGKREVITSLSFGSGVTLPADCSFMFYECNNLTNLDVSSFDTSRVENMSYMFCSCGSLANLDISSFNTSVVKNMADMFWNCGNLASLDVSNFDTSYVEDMGGMFCGCAKLNSLDVSGFDTSWVGSMELMFYGCTKLTSLDVSGFDTGRVGSVGGMFGNCIHLIELDMSSFNFTGNTDTYTNMLDNCPLQSLWIPRNVGNYSVPLNGYTYFKVNSTSTVTTESYTTLPVGQATSFQMVRYINGAVISIPHTVTVTFDSNGGNSTPPPQSTTYCGKVTEPTAPAKDGYTFSGWYRNTALKTAWNFDRNTVGYSITLHAKWTAKKYMVSFDTNDGSTVDSITGDYGKKITPPTVPTKKGYTFDGWYEDSGLTTKWDFDNDTIPADITLYAKWAVNQYTVSFDTNDSSTVGSVTGDYGTTITPPAVPTKEGYTFDGWYKGQDLATPWNFDTDTIPAENITLYAKWAVNQYTVSFDASGGSTADSITADYGTKITQPADPTKKGYIFDGWYKEAELTTAWNFAPIQFLPGALLFTRNGQKILMLRSPMSQQIYQWERLNLLPKQSLRLRVQHRDRMPRLLPDIIS